MDSCFIKVTNTGVKAFKTSLLALQIETMPIESHGLDSIKSPVVSLSVVKKGEELPGSKGGLNLGCQQGTW